MARARRSETVGKTKQPNSAEVIPAVSAEAIVSDLRDFAGPKRITKAEVIRRVVGLVRRADLDYEALKYVTREVRKRLGLTRGQRGRSLPRLLSGREVVAFFAAVDKAGDLQHQIMLRLLVYTGLRVAELVGIERKHVDLDALTVRVVEGKGGQDRTVLFPESFRLALQAYMARAPRARFLFTTRRGTAFTTRRIQQIVAIYGEAAGVEQAHPHAFRHYALTELTRAGLTDAQIQLLSGHATKKSLEVYQHLGLEAVRDDYEKAMRNGLV